MQNLFSQDYAKDRTETQILAHSPIKLMLGKKEFNAKPLPIRKGHLWREKLSEALNNLASSAFNGSVNSDNFMKGIMVAFFRFPDQVLELLIAYAPDVLESEREWLYDNATDEEVVVGFSRIMAVAFPYSSLLGMMTAATKTLISPQ